MTPQVDITEEQAKFIHCMKAFFRAADFYAKQWFGCALFGPAKFEKPSLGYRHYQLHMSLRSEYSFSYFIDSLDFNYQKAALITYIRKWIVTVGIFLCGGKEAFFDGRPPVQSIGDLAFTGNQDKVKKFIDFLYESKEVDALYQLELIDIT